MKLTLFQIFLWIGYWSIACEYGLVPWRLDGFLLMVIVLMMPTVYGVDKYRLE